MRATDENDWAYLATLCDPAVAEAYATRGQLNHLHDHICLHVLTTAPFPHRYATRGQRGSAFSRVHVELRAKLDGVLSTFLRSLRESPPR